MALRSLLLVSSLALLLMGCRSERYSWEVVEEGLWREDTPITFTVWLNDASPVAKEERVPPENMRILIDVDEVDIGATRPVCFDVFNENEEPCQGGSKNGFKFDVIFRKSGSPEMRLTATNTDDVYETSFLILP